MLWNRLDWNPLPHSRTMAWPAGQGCVEMKTGGKLCIEEGTAGSVFPFLDALIKTFPE
jgi:hypothetical protein